MNIEEMKLPLAEHKNFSELFARELRENSRPFADPNDNATLCSPADSLVLAYGEVDGDQIHCVKGHTYSVGELLYGEKYAEAEVRKLFPSLRKSATQSLYYAVLYLSPSDCRRFFSPTSLVLKERCHILGYLHPVSPKYLVKHKVGFALHYRVD